MSIETRQPDDSNNKLKESPYLAKVVGHLDPSFGGGLKIQLLRTQGNPASDDTTTYTAKYLSPFAGNTALEFNGFNKDSFDDTQKSYGMTFIPPDVGNTVVVIFIDGNIGKCYYLGCVSGTFVNNMIPGIASSDKYEATPEQKAKYGNVDRLPVAEINRKIYKDANGLEVDQVKRPVHPIADRFLEQGTLEDDVRGPTTSSQRRETPSNVYGISTPGPLDKRQGSNRKTIGTKQTKTLSPVPVSRLGGTQFVMDDGDDQFQRATPASEGPVVYKDILAGEKGDPTIPYNEHVRIRTRTGHQILLHNSEDLIYIGNARGTTWIELTSNGKIDIFAEDSISVHTKTDMNFYADRDINMEAGRNVNIKASAEYSKLAPTDEKGLIKDAKEYESGRIQLESAFNTNILIGANGKIETRKYVNENSEEADGNLDINIKGNTKLATGTGDVEEAYRLDLNTDGNVFITTTGSLDLYSEDNNKFTAALGATDILSGSNHTETASVIHMNGPQAAEAVQGEVANIVTDLITHDNLVTNKDLTWSSSKFIESYTLKSIMRRIPQHEPWLLHENQAPQSVAPDFTDRELE